MADIEEAIRRLKGRQNLGVVVVDRSQRVLRTSYTGDRAGQNEIVCNNALLLMQEAERIIKDVDPINDLLFLRIKMRGGEIMVTQDKDAYLITAQPDEKGRNDET